MSAPELVLYGAHGCHLCEVAERVLEGLAARHGLSWRKQAIDGDPELETRFRAEIPVLMLGEEKLAKYRIEPDELLRKLRARGVGLR